MASERAQRGARLLAELARLNQEELAAWLDRKAAGAKPGTASFLRSLRDQRLDATEVVARIIIRIDKSRGEPALSGVSDAGAVRNDTGQNAQSFDTFRSEDGGAKLYPPRGGYNYTHARERSEKGCSTLARPLP